MSEQVLDPAIFQEMQELMDDALGEFIETYLGNTPKLISQIEQGLNKGDAELIYQNAHQLKGGSGSIGAMGLHDLAQLIEQAGRNQSIDAVADLLQQLKSEFEQVRIALQQHV